MVGGRAGDRGLYDGRNVSGARMCMVEVGATEDSMVDVMCKDQDVLVGVTGNCGWR